MHKSVTIADLDRLLERRVYFTQDGSHRFGDGQVLVFDENGTVEPYAAILQGIEVPTIGAFSYTLSGLDPHTRIGRYCSISWGIRVMALNHPLDFSSTSSFAYDPHFIIFRQCLADHGVEDFARYGGRSSRPNRIQAPVIEHDVWIGQDVLLARGITLGTGCVVGAGSVVTKSVPPYAIVGGNPARIIRYRFAEPVMATLLASHWWEYGVQDFAALRYDDPMLFMAQLRDLRAQGAIAPFKPEPILLRDFLSDPVG